MNIEDLKTEIPFKWRVQSANKYGAICVAYIDARSVQDRLDEVCGPMGWQCKFEDNKTTLFCSIGIQSAEGDWVWKSDAGIESNVEKQKGEASDSFKRAAVMWGIGRFLYSTKIIKLDSIEENGKFYPAYEGKRLYGDRISKACDYKLKNS